MGKSQGKINFQQAKFTNVSQVYVVVLKEHELLYKFIT